MAPTTISIARVLQLGVPIAWQEAVEVARAAEAKAERHARRLTVEGCVISTAGTVEVGTNGTDRQGADLSGLQLLAILIEGQQAPAELRALAATADDALSSFPSESTSAGEQTLTLDWFVRPNPEVEIASLATRALEAAAPPIEAPRSTPRPGPSLVGSYKSLPMTFEPRAAERRPHLPVAQDAPPAQTLPLPVPDRHATALKTAAADRHAQPASPDAAEPHATPPSPHVVERHAEPPSPPMVERHARPAEPAVPERPTQRSPQPPVMEATRPAQPPASARRAEPPRPAAPKRQTQPPGPAAAERHSLPSPTAAAQRRADPSKPVLSEPAAVRSEPVAAERRVVRPEPAAAQRRHQHEPVRAIAQFRAEGLQPAAAPRATAVQVRPAVHAIGLQLSAVIEQGRRLGAVPLVVIAVTVVATGGLAAWALFSPALPAPLTYRSLGPLAPLARAFEPSLPVQARLISPRGASPVSRSGIGTSGTVASLPGAGGVRRTREDAPVSAAVSASAPTGSLIAAGSGGPSGTPTFSAAPSTAPPAVAAPTPSTIAPPSPAGRVVASTLGAEPRDRRVYTESDVDVEPPTMRRPQLQMERRADTEPSDSYVEVVVDERGEVTQVRLRSSDLSLNDRMIVAAAKAWQFEPAMKDGRPVKYVLRLPVTR
jgi:hypothetical protein